MESDIFKINCESLRKLGIDPAEGVNYLLNKKAITLNPVHVRTIQVLKQQTVPS